MRRTNGVLRTSVLPFQEHCHDQTTTNPLIKSTSKGDRLLARQRGACRCARPRRLPAPTIAANAAPRPRRPGSKASPPDLIAAISAPTRWRAGCAFRNNLSISPTWIRRNPGELPLCSHVFSVISVKRFLPFIVKIRLQELPMPTEPRFANSQTSAPSVGLRLTHVFYAPWPMRPTPAVALGSLVGNHGHLYCTPWAARNLAAEPLVHLSAAARQHYTACVRSRRRTAARRRPKAAAVTDQAERQAARRTDPLSTPASSPCSTPTPTRPCSTPGPPTCGTRWPNAQSCPRRLRRLFAAWTIEHLRLTALVARLLRQASSPCDGQQRNTEHTGLHGAHREKAKQFLCVLCDSSVFSVFSLSFLLSFCKPKGLHHAHRCGRASRPHPAAPHPPPYRPGPHHPAHRGPVRLLDPAPGGAGLAHITTPAPTTRRRRQLRHSSWPTPAPIAGRARPPASADYQDVNLSQFGWGRAAPQSSLGWGS